ncbi:MAG: bifunctional phosphopantothenoylcysteine decarboxylase/phosphopantothenate--cysteine ligase CoaBC [Pseudohongiellaceae bacterium]
MSQSATEALNPARLTNKRILLGITGGIAAYKSAELTRMLQKAGAEVRVVMTRAATEFITPLTLQALSGNRVHLDLLDADAEAGMGHIELARWADVILVAPASADFLARTVQGHAGDLLSTLLLATRAPVALAPAMNQGMWEDAATQRNLVTLRERGFHLFGPGSGQQACGETGPGRMMEPEDLLLHIAGLFDTGLLDGLHITITAGPTKEAIDPVRYISNHSSGKMGFALAEAAAEAGAKVTLIAGPVHLATPDRVQRIDVISARDMREAVLAHRDTCDVFIGVAAVADYRPADVTTDKIKKSAERLTLELVRNPDIISEVAGWENRPFVAGFAAETRNVEEYGREKMLRKGLDLLFANHATDTFHADSVRATAIWKEDSRTLGPASKTAVARDMLALIRERLDHCARR